MARASRLVVVEALTEGPGIAEALAARGYHALQVDKADTVVAELLSSVRPEAIVIAEPERMPPGGVPASRRLAGRLSRSGLTRHMPIVVIGDRHSDDSGPITELPSAISHDELAARIGTLTRRGLLARELERRLRVAAAFGGAVPAMPAQRVVDDPRILVALSPHLLRSVQEAFPAPASVIGAPTLPATIGFLEQPDFDVVVLPGEDAAESGALVEAIRRDTRHAELPVAIAGGAPEMARALCGAGADAILPPAIHREAAARIAALASEARYRQAMRGALELAMPPQARDSLTGLATHGYFCAWLKAIVADCDRWGDLVSLIAIEIEDLRTLNERHGFSAVDRMMAGIGSIVASLTRTEDCACRYSGSRLLVGVPAMPVESLRRMRERLVSVINQTGFRDDTGSPMESTLATRMSQWRDGISAVALVEDVFCGFA